MTPWIMKLLRVAAAVLNQTPLDWRGNLENVRAAIASAREQGATVLCLPELCLCGYGCEDAFQSPNTQRMALRLLHEVLPETAGMVVSLGLPLVVNNGLFNVAALVVDGRILGFVAKQHLAGDGIHYEPRWFKPWPVGIQDTVTLVGEGGNPTRTYPVGDLYFDLAGVRLGFEICEDAWAAARPGIRLAQKGVDLLLNPSASHFAFGKLEVRQRFVLEGSRVFGVSYLYANLLGNEAGRAIYDGEAMIATAGRSGGDRAAVQLRRFPGHLGRRRSRCHPVAAIAPRELSTGARTHPDCVTAPNFAGRRWGRARRAWIPRRGRRRGGSRRRNSRGPCLLGVVRLPAQEPIDGIRGVAQRWGGFVVDRLPRITDGGIRMPRTGRGGILSQARAHQGA